MAGVVIVKSPVSGDKLYSPSDEIRRKSHCSSIDEYRKLYKRSIDDPSGFWGELGRQFYWKVPPSKDRFLEYNFDPSKGPVKINWMAGAVTNVCYNVLDRNIQDKGFGNKVAFFW